MPSIFISYRREDSAGWTGRLAERLKQKFGSESIFMDIDTIQPGTDFTEALRSAVGACEVLLAMIGPGWYVAKNAEGQTRLEDPNDWIRMELTTALRRNIPIIPVLVGGASLPKMSTLPDDLKKLFHYQTHELTDKRWDYDSTQLIQVLEKVICGAKPKRNIAWTLLTRRSTWVTVGVLGLLLAVGSVSLLRHFINREDGTPHKSDPIASKDLREYPMTLSAGQQVDLKPWPYSITYKILAIRLDRSDRDRLALTFKVRGASNNASSFNLWKDSFRLVIDDVPREPIEGMNKVVSGNSAEEGEVTFLLPNMARNVVLRIIWGDQMAHIPIDLQRTS